MKSQSYCMLAILIFVLFSCSYEHLDEPLIEGKELIQNGRDSRAPAFVFKTEAFFKIVDSEQCGHLNQMVINGSGKSTLMGHFKLKAKRCTDFKKVNYIKGSHIDKNGNQMFFYTDDYGLDSNGAYCIYVFYDGTGPYADFSKVVKVYIRDEMIDKTSGRFFSNGSLE